MRHLFLLFLCSLLAACASFWGLKPKAPEITCSEIEAFGHSYFSNYSGQFNSGPITTGTLDLFKNPEVLSRLSLPSDYVNELAPQKIFDLAVSDSSEINVLSRYKDYIGVFLPPRTASKYFNQIAFGKPLPAFLFIPKESFYDGICRDGVKPFFVGSVELKADLSNFGPQVIISIENIKSLASALYLDPRSNNISDLIDHYNPGFVNESNWGNWIEIQVNKKSRNVFRRFWNYVSGSTLGELGDIIGIGQNGSAPAVPELTKLIEDNNVVFAGWKDKLNVFSSTLQSIRDDIQKLSTVLDGDPFDKESFKQLSNSVVKEISKAESALKIHRKEMTIERGIFITQTEIDYVVELFKNDLYKANKDYLDLIGKYNNLLTFGSNAIIDPDLILTPPPVLVNGTEINSVRRTQDIPIPKYDGNLKADGVAYIEPVAVASQPTQYKVKVSLLANLTDGIEIMKSSLRSRVYAEQSCSKRVSFVNLDIKEQVKNGAYSKPIDVRVAFWSCATFDYYWVCGKWYKPETCKKRKVIKTKLYKTTAKGSVDIQLMQNGDDFLLKYSYGMCLHGFLCTSDYDESPLLTEKLKEDPEVKKYMDQFGAKIYAATITKSKKGDAMLVLGLETAPLNGVTAVSLLNELEKEQ